MANTGGRRDDWRTTAPDRTGRTGAKGQKKTARRWAVAALVVALLGGLLLSLPLFLRKSPEPICFAVPVSEYHKVRDSRWPPNPWAEADAHGIRDLFTGDSAQAFQHQEKAALTRELANEVTRADEQKRPLLVYLTALGTVADDTPYLLPADARPDEPASWLTLDEVLAPVRRGTTPRLVILDVRPVRSPRAALPTNDVNELIDAALAAKSESDDLPLLVLTANTPVTGPRVLTTVRHTAFGLALERGARGAADGWLPNDRPNQEVTARELAAYVRDCTHSASAGAQRPQLYGRGPDFKLLSVPADRPALPDPERLKYPEFLARAWQDVDAARKADLPARAPRAMRQQTDAAVDAERGWLAGASEQSLKDRFDGTFTAFRGALAGVALAAPKPPVASLARARLTTPDFDSHVRSAGTALQGVLTLLKSDTYADARKVDPAKARAMVEMEMGKVKLPDAGLPFAAVAAVAWAAAVETPQVWFIRTLLGVLDGLPLKEKPPLAELAALQLVTQLPESRDPRVVAEVLPAWLDATAAAEAAVVFDGRALPLVKGRLEKAENLYTTEAVVMVDLNTSRARFAEVVANLLAARDEYTAVREYAAEVGKAWSRVQEVRAALADLADRYPHELARPTAGRECSLTALTDAYTVVMAQLSAEVAPDLARLRRDADALRTHYQSLLDPVRVSAAGEILTIESALDWPGWSAADRIAVVQRFQDAAGEVLARWPVGPTGREPAPPRKLGREVFEGSVRDLRNRADLIRIWDEVRARQIRAELADKEKLTPARFTPLAVTVTAELRTEPRRRYEAGEAGRSQLGWAVHPDDLPALPAEPVARTNPEAVDRREVEDRLGRWVAVGRYSRLSKALQALDDPAEPGGARGERFVPVVKRYKATADVFP